MLVLVIEILEMLVLVTEFRICIYEITIHHLKNVTLLLRHIVFVVDDARPASSPSTRFRRRLASKDPCPGLGSAGLALGGATWRGAPLGEEPDLGVPSSTLIFFGGIRVGHIRCRGSRPHRRWCVAMSGRKMSTSIATWLLWTTSGSPLLGGFFGQMTGDMIL